MAYTAWSVVFGETPSAAKWNLIGTNEAGLRDGTNLQINNNQDINWRNAANSANLAGVRIAADDILRLSQIEVQENTTDSTAEDVMIQAGWGVLDGAAAATLTTTVTLATAVHEDETFSIITGGLGLKVGAGTKISDFAASNSRMIVNALVVVVANSITSFTAIARNNDDSNFSAANDYGFSWMVIGRKA